ncbi:MAG: ArsR family transcriptional regulator [Planctomycetaceae bacterium]|nr:ArsR family transcriptional regulator [Planctomycetaceae bacterium]
MEELQAIRALAALAHESRLRIFRLLAKQGTTGLAAGKIAEALQLPAPTLSFHLKELSNAGLVTDRREGRSVIYSLNAEGMQSLLGFLLDDCCGGQPELCGPVCRPEVVQLKPLT